MSTSLTWPAVVALLAVAVLPTGRVAGEEIQARKQFVYVLQLAPRLHQEASWTDTENAVVTQHFEYLTRAVQAGQVILAGRTMEPLEKTFGLVIFEAESEAAAGEFMQSDPAVKAGVMTATLHPYAVALQRK
jgi:uncharacterized protein YciI